MSADTYFARDGHVYVRSGAWDVRLDQDMCDGLLTIWFSAGAHALFNELHQAVADAGWITWTRPKPRLVTEADVSPVTRVMFERSHSLALVEGTQP